MGLLKYQIVRDVLLIFGLRIRSRKKQKFHNKPMTCANRLVQMLGIARKVVRLMGAPTGTCWWGYLVHCFWNRRPPFPPAAHEAKVGHSSALLRVIG